MKKKLLIVCFLAGAIIITASFTSAIGVDVEKIDSKKGGISSPLFAVRQNSVIKKQSQKINSNYLGKNKILSIFFAERTTFSSNIDKALELLEKNPLILNIILEKLETSQIVIDKLKEYDIGMSEFKNYLKSIKNNPSILEEEIKNIETYVTPGDIPFPTGLNETNPFIIFILFITVVPIFIILTAVIATATIITCFNINGCFERLFEALVGGFLQGLKLPDGQV